MRKEEKKAVHQGQGRATLQYLVEKEHLLGSRLLAEMILEPGASIGEHVHNNETEFYIFLSGNGIALDNGIEKKITAGDVLVTRHRERHGLKNTGTESLRFIVLVNCH